MQNIHFVLAFRRVPAFKKKHGILQGRCFQSHPWFMFSVFRWTEAFNYVCIMYVRYIFIPGHLHLFLVPDFYHKSTSVRHANHLRRILPRVLLGRKNLVLLSDNGPDWSSEFLEKYICTYICICIHTYVCTIQWRSSLFSIIIRMFIVHVFCVAMQGLGYILYAKQILRYVR